jgi:hypothetical protein
VLKPSFFSSHGQREGNSVKEEAAAAGEKLTSRLSSSSLSSLLTGRDGSKLTAVRTEDVLCCLPTCLSACLPVFFSVVERCLL